MATTTIGTIQLIATIDTSDYKKGAKDIDNTNKDIESSSEKTSSKGSSVFGSMAKFGLGAVITAATAAGAAIISNIGGAIKRVDTLNNSTRTFENMGFQAAEIIQTMDALKKSILGLPTPLDAAVSGVQLIAGSINNIGKAQKIFSAVNNAVIGFGGTTEQVAGAVRQLSQDLAGGTLTAETWNSLLDNGLGPTLNAIAKQMGKTSKELKAGLSDGSVSVEDFTNRLIDMNEKGGGGMASLQKIAKDSTSGISTSFENMNTAITRGIASIVEKIGANNISSTITAIGSAFESALKAVSQGVDTAKYAIDTFMEALKPMFDYIGGNQEVLQVLQLSLVAIAVISGVIAIAIGLGLVAALTLATAAVEILIQVFQVAINVINTIGEAIASYIVFMGQMVDAVGQGVNLIKQYFGGLPSWFQNLWNGIIKLFGEVGTSIGNAIGNSFKSVITGVVGKAVGIINGFIDSINNVVGTINKIPGVKIGTIGRLGIPMLADGGIVSSPTLAMIGEGRDQEAVIPLSKLDAMMNGSGKDEITYNIGTINIGSEVDGDRWIKKLTKHQDITSKGLTPAVGY